MNTATENLAARESFLADVVVTAVEGGIRSWATVDEYHWFDPEQTMPSYYIEAAPHGGGNAWATFYLDEDEDTRLWDLTPRVIASAFRELLREDYQPTRGQPWGDDNDWIRVEDLQAWGYRPSLEWRDRVLRARRENDAGELDAADADMLVQLGCFGAVVFG